MKKELKLKKNRKAGKVGVKVILFIIIAFVAAIAVIITTVLSQYSSYVTTMNQEQAVKAMESIRSKIDDYKVNTKNLSDSLARDNALQMLIPNKDSNGIAENLSWIDQTSNVDFIIVTDNAGSVVYDSRKAEPVEENAAGQQHIVSALSGTSYTSYEKNEDMKFAVLTASPVFSSNGEVIGTVTTGYDLSETGFVDDAKALYKTEFTVFSGDTRINTTLLDADGNRAIGTQMNSAYAEVVLNQGQTLTGEGVIFGEQYLFAYLPLLDNNNKAIGALFAGQPEAQAVEKSNKIVLFAICITAAALALLAFLSSKIIRQILTKPLSKLVVSAKKIAA